MVDQVFPKGIEEVQVLITKARIEQGGEKQCLVHVKGTPQWNMFHMVLWFFSLQCYTRGKCVIGVAVSSSPKDSSMRECVRLIFESHYLLSSYRLNFCNVFLL